MDRFHTIRPVVCDGSSLDDVVATLPEGASARTLRRLCKRWHEEQARSGRGIIGLIPLIEHRGNRGSRLTAEHEALIAGVLKEADDPRNRKDGDLYGEYCEKAEEAGLKACAPSTFKRRVQLLDTQRRTRKRRGHKAAAAEAPFVWWIEEVTPRHGQFPWGVVHIDHTRVDLVIRLGGQKSRKLRVWLTVVFCAYSRTVLGFELSFDPPSVASIMMALRDCVRRYGRLPHTIVVDRGAEFESVWFELFCAQYLITKRSRPAGNPRFGSLIERFFGTTNTQFFHRLRGNTQLLRNPRGLTPEVDPTQHAVWTLPMLTSALEAYFFEVYAEPAAPGTGPDPQGGVRTGAQTHGCEGTSLGEVRSGLPDQHPPTSTVLGRDRQGSGERQGHPDWRHPVLERRLQIIRVTGNAGAWSESTPFDISHVFAWRPDTRGSGCVASRSTTRRFAAAAGKKSGYSARKSGNGPRMAGRPRGSPPPSWRRFMTSVRKTEDAELQRLKDTARDEAGTRGATPRLVTDGGDAGRRSAGYSAGFEVSGSSAPRTGITPPNSGISNDVGLSWNQHAKAGWHQPTA